MLKVNGNATLFAIGAKGTPLTMSQSKDGKTSFVRGSVSSSAGKDREGKTTYTHDITFTAFGILAQNIVNAASGCYIAIYDADVQDASYMDQNNVFHARTNLVINRAEIIRAGQGGTMPVRNSAPAAQTPAPTPAPQYAAPAQPAPQQYAQAPQYTAPAATPAPAPQQYAAPAQQPMAAPAQPAPTANPFNVTDVNDPWAGYMG